LPPAAAERPLTRRVVELDTAPGACALASRSTKPLLEQAPIAELREVVGVGERAHALLGAPALGHVLHAAFQRDRLTLEIAASDQAAAQHARRAVGAERAQVERRGAIVFEAAPHGA
jgi:hypothetical protein